MCPSLLITFKIFFFSFQKYDSISYAFGGFFFFLSLRSFFISLCQSLIWETCRNDFCEYCSSCIFFLISFCIQHFGVVGFSSESMGFVEQQEKPQEPLCCWPPGSLASLPFSFCDLSHPVLVVLFYFLYSDHGFYLYLTGTLKSMSTTILFFESTTLLN